MAYKAVRQGTKKQNQVFTLTLFAFALQSVIFLKQNTDKFVTFTK